MESEEMSMAVMNFQAMTETSDQELAIRYLSGNSWDITRAVEQYFSEKAVSQMASTPSAPRPQAPPPSHPIYPPSQFIPIDPGFTAVERPSPGIMGRVKGIFSKILPDSIRSLEPGGDEFLYMVKQNLQNCPMPNFLMGTLEAAIHEASLKQKPLLIYIHDLVENKTASTRFFLNTVGNKEAANMLNAYYVVFGVDASKNEGKRTLKMLNLDTVPAIAIKIAMNDMVPHTLYTINDPGETKESFLEKLKDALVNYSVIVSQLNPFMPARFPNSETERKLHEDHLLREMQKQEFDIAQQKDLDEKRRREEAERRQKQEEEKASYEVAQRERILEEKKETLAPEPDEGDPNTCEIAFRLPSGKRMVRRFPKTATVKSLYAFIALLEGADEIEGNYEISQAVPRKTYSNMDATLEEEGLVPKAAVQVVLTESD